MISPIFHLLSFICSKILLVAFIIHNDFKLKYNSGTDFNKKMQYDNQTSSLEAFEMNIGELWLTIPP